jgi:hypothetical protein
MDGIDMSIREWFQTCTMGEVSLEKLMKIQTAAFPSFGIFARR